MRDVDAVVLFLSKAAQESAWVRREFNSAVSRFLDHLDERVLLVVRLDDSDVPELIRDLKWIDGRNGDYDAIADFLMASSKRPGIGGEVRAAAAVSAEVEFLHQCGATESKTSSWLDLRGKPRRRSGGPANQMRTLENWQASALPAQPAPHPERIGRVSAAESTAFEANLPELIQIAADEVRENARRIEAGETFAGTGRTGPERAPSRNRNGYHA